MEQRTKERVSGKRERRSRAEWGEEVRQWKASGRSADEYATARGLNAGTLLVWSSKLRGECRHEGRSGITETLKFVPVRVAEREDALNSGSQGDDGRIEIVFGNGRMVRITGDVSARALSAVLEVVEGGQRC
jgi:hypothetical protein